MIKANDHLSDDNPEKGAFLRDWLMKRDVVFARTTPDQKLMIVEACQNLSHVVAVTGDGVNDSPAIKRSNIGIAMGIVGTDVAKDAADIILMDDNFASIVEGIKQGRIVFDTLKKIISYNMCSNIPEFLPVVGFFILGFPIPMTTFSILLIDVCADIYPNVAMAYEGAESDTMNEKPRNVKIDRLCTYKMLAWSFGFLGILHTSAGMLSYFVVMNDYGFKPEGTLRLTYQEYIIPEVHDTFNPDDPYRGNTNAFLLHNVEKLGIDGDKLFELQELQRDLNFIANSDQEVDFRVGLLNWDLKKFSTCTYEGLGYHKRSKVCYTLEAVRHAQSAYLANTVVVQVSSGWAYRTIVQSIFQFSFDNMDMNFAYFLENAFICFFLYVPGVSYGLALRGILVQHWCIGFGTFVVFFLWSEAFKYLIRNVNNPDGSRGFFYIHFRY